MWNRVVTLFVETGLMVAAVVIPFLVKNQAGLSFIWFDENARKEYFLPHKWKRFVTSVCKRL